MKYHFLKFYATLIQSIRGEKMITIGLTGWSDHPLVAPDRKRKLEDYASHFPFVEIDTSFYGIPTEKSIKSWIDKTPDAFQFIPKAYSAMTLHRPWEKEYSSLVELFDTFKVRFYPMVKEKRIKAFLFQFPPFFHYNQQNIDYLNTVNRLMGTLPVAVEFRHPSWFSKDNNETTLKVLKDNFFFHTVVDEPQTPGNSTPTILEVTDTRLALYRLHGRNYSGWLNANEDPNWRETRTLHDYNQEELLEIQKNTEILAQSAEEVAVIFNNNSGGHAAKNAKELQKLFGIDFQGLHPQQLDLF